MSFKPNPGCELPEVQVPPELQTFLTNLVKQASARALPEAKRAQARAAAASKQAADAVTAAADRAKKYQALAQRFLNISCPLPDVPDPNAGP